MRMKSVESINPFKSVIQTIYDIITKEHGGSIALGGQEEKGAEYVIKLPLD